MKKPRSFIHYVSKRPYVRLKQSASDRRESEMGRERVRERGTKRDSVESSYLATLAFSDAAASMERIYFH